MLQRRFRRLRAVLERRQPDLTVLLENVHKPHNFAAVLRSADAAGLLEAHAVVADGELRTSLVSAAGSHKWVATRFHPEISAAAAALRERGFRLLAAHPVAAALDYRHVDFTRPTAVLFGQEKDGLTPQALDLADGALAIPMVGFVASLNVSVAAAVVLFEAQRQRFEAGLYDRSRLDRETFDRTLFEWAHPKLAQRCRRERRPYPPLGPDGEPLKG
jgi:tRNA (guanosine-2'-O-)-methyltransferase